LNFALDLALIFGAGLGVIGAALATTGVLVVTALVYAAGVRALDGPVPRPRATRADLKAVVGLGAPIGGQLLAPGVLFSVATAIAAPLGKLPAAAHSVALTLSSVTFSCALGAASATSVRVGHATGAGDRELARRRGLAGIALGAGVMAAFSLVLALAPR